MHEGTFLVSVMPPSCGAVDMLCGSSDVLEGASLLLAQALKGNLPTAESLASGQSDAALPPLVVSSCCKPLTLGARCASS